MDRACPEPNDSISEQPITGNEPTADDSDSGAVAKERVVLFTACLVDIYNDHTVVREGAGFEPTSAGPARRIGRPGSWGKFIVEVRCFKQLFTSLAFRSFTVVSLFTSIFQ